MSSKPGERERSDSWRLDSRRPDSWLEALIFPGRVLRRVLVTLVFAVFALLAAGVLVKTGAGSGDAAAPSLPWVGPSLSILFAAAAIFPWIPWRHAWRISSAVGGGMLVSGTVQLFTGHRTLEISISLIALGGAVVWFAFLETGRIEVE